MPKVICIDLDGTIIHYYKGKWDKTKFGKPVQGVKKFLLELMKDGWWIIIYTCRNDRNKIGETLLYYGIKKGVHYSAINRRKNVLEGTYKGKCGADIYLDDRGLCFTGNWKKTYKQIKNFKPWEKK